VTIGVNKSTVNLVESYAMIYMSWPHCASTCSLTWIRYGCI